MPIKYIKVENVAIFHSKISQFSVLKLFSKLAALQGKTIQLFRSRSTRSLFSQFRLFSFIAPPHNSESYCRFFSFSEFVPRKSSPPYFIRVESCNMVSRFSIGPRCAFRRSRHYSSAPSPKPYHLLSCNVLRKQYFHCYKILKNQSEILKKIMLVNLKHLTSLPPSAHRFRRLLHRILHQTTLYITNFYFKFIVSQLNAKHTIF